MDAGVSQLLFFGIGAVFVGLTVLVLLLRTELLPASLLEGGGRWFLGAALGLGIIAFSIKLAIISTLSTFPSRTIEPLISKSDAGYLPQRDIPNLPTFLSGKAGLDPNIWRPLPERAPDPQDNPTTPQKVALGERLFFDPNLSRDRTVACASCHDLLRKGGADGLPGAIGITRVPGRRNAPTVWNAAFQLVLFWDGRAGSLEEQAAGPPLNPDEMGMPSAAAVEERVKADPAYAPMFAKAFGPDAPITMDRITAAIAAYERTLITPDTPYDRFVRGDRGALTMAQKRGMWLFQSVGCVNCHTGPNFSAASVYGIVSPYRLFPAWDSHYKTRYDLGSDKGKASAASKLGIWRVPSLRNVAVTAPYFHNGSVSELAEAVRVMAVSQLNVLLSEEGDAAQPANGERRDPATGRRILAPRDINDIAVFLDALTSDRLRRKSASK